MSEVYTISLNGLFEGQAGEYAEVEETILRIEMLNIGFDLDDSFRHDVTPVRHINLYADLLEHAAAWLRSNAGLVYEFGDAMIPGLQMIVTGDCDEPDPA